MGRMRKMVCVPIERVSSGTRERNMPHKKQDFDDEHFGGLLLAERRRETSERKSPERIIKRMLIDPNMPGSSTPIFVDFGPLANGRKVIELAVQRQERQL